MFQALIFDFDGVILDSEPLHYQACSYVLEKFGIVLSYADYVNNYLGLTDKEMFPKLFAESHSLSMDTMATLIEEKSKKYQEIVKQCEHLPMIDSVDRYIAYISKIIPKIAICSGSSRDEIMAVLTKLNHGELIPYFNTIVSSEDVKHGKPSPEGYLLTAKRLHVLPHHCLVIEDTPYGVAAAKAAGMHVIALLSSYTRDEFQQADKIITHFDQLILESEHIESK